MVIRSFFLFLDMFTDCLLIRDYYDQWTREADTRGSAVFFPGVVQPPRDPCKVRPISSADMT